MAVGGTETRGLQAQKQRSQRGPRGRKARGGRSEFPRGRGPPRLYYSGVSCENRHLPRKPSLFCHFGLKTVTWLAGKFRSDGPRGWNAARDDPVR